MIIPISLIEFINKIIGKSTTVAIYSGISVGCSKQIKNIKISGDPITIQDVLEAFDILNNSLEENFDKNQTKRTFDRIVFDEEYDRYVIHWND